MSTPQDPPPPTDDPVAATPDDAPAAAPASPTGVPVASARRSIASYPRHREAVRAVDWLSDEGFAVERTAIVGSGLRAVEQVTGRVTTATAAASGAGQGAFIGLIFALFFGIFFTGPDFLGLLLYAVLLGAALGAAFSAFGHFSLGGTRDFASISSMEADRYDVVVDAEVADDAAAILARLPAER